MTKNKFQLTAEVSSYEELGVSSSFTAITTSQQVLHVVYYIKFLLHMLLPPSITKVM
jgi:hypothetical protein